MSTCMYMYMYVCMCTTILCVFVGAIVCGWVEACFVFTIVIPQSWDNKADVQLVTTIGCIQCVYRCTACMYNHVMYMYICTAYVMHVQCMCVVTMYIYTYCTVYFF